MQSIMSRDTKHGGGEDFLRTARHFPTSDNSGLPSYRSAPSSFLGALLDLESACDNNSSSGDETEAFFSALMDSRDLNHKTGSAGYSSMKQEGGSVVGSYSIGMETAVAAPAPAVHRNSSNLARQSSSPAGFFNGFGVMGDVGSYRLHNQAAEAMNFSSGPSSTSRFMPSIPENDNSRAGFTNESQFKSLKRSRDGERNMFSNFNDFENQNQEPRKNGKMAVVEKYLHFQQETTVPCQMRAKRGCATHPRSIAERMRRTRISEKMKKLQDLFPNMDKQTNTADMLDLAVEYIKDLQKQVQTLQDAKARCVCSAKLQ